MDVLSALRNTSKGKLQYDGSWYKQGVLSEVLSECTSPPSIPAPPQASTARVTPDRSLPITGLSLTEAEEEEYRKKVNSFHEHSQDSDREKGADRSNSSWCSPWSKDKKDDLNRSNQQLNKSATSPHWSNRVDLSISDHRCNTPFGDDNRSPSTVNKSQDELDKSHNKLNTSHNESGTSQDEASRSGSDELLVPKLTEVDFALRDYEDNMQNMVRKSVEERRRLFEHASATFGLEAESALDAVYGRQEREAQRALAVALAEQRARSDETQRFEQQCKERHKQHAAMMNTKLLEAQAKKKLQEEEEENQRRAELIEQLETLSKIQQELKNMCTNSVKAITTCVAPQHLSENTKKASQVLVQIIQRLDSLKQSHASGPSVQYIQDALELTKKARACSDIIEKGVDAANKQGKAEAEVAAKEKAATAAAAAATAAEAAKAVAARADEVLCVSEQTFLRYQKLQEQLKAVQDSYAQLTTDTNMKKYKFDLQKAVNTPINAIAPTSAAHLRDKFQRLCGILQGAQVDVGGKRVSAADHAAGKAFVSDLFAKKVIKQGEEQVASNHESAFAIAAVTVRVWAHVSAVGDLLLAHFHQRCPYTVPYYLPKKDGQSSEDYYKSLGYLYSDGEVEAQDKFLKRMSGVMRLYASILVSTPPRGAAHPHGGVSQAWLWLADTLNLEPRPDITATMIYDMLAVTGHALFAAYKGQFVKLLQLLCTDYLPKVKAVTPAGSGGPVVRLENFLRKCIASSSIPVPDGMLSPNFWAA